MDGQLKGTVEKLTDAFIAILAGAHGLAEINTRMTKRYLDGGIARLLPNSEIMKMLVS